MPDEYATSASVYNVIYEVMKDYRKEADRVHELIHAHKSTDGNALLDVAKKRLPGVPLHQGDMSDFDLGKQFDAVTCLFSAIGHMHTKDRLHAAIACMAKHLKLGGVLIVEPWIPPDQWQDGTISANFVPEKKVARINKSTRDGNISHLNMHHFVDWDEETGTAKYFPAHHDVALYTVEEMMDAFRSAGLDVSYDEEGLMGRGIYIGVKNS